VWPIVVGASTIVGLLAGGLMALDDRDATLPEPPSGLSATATTCAPPRCARIVSAVTLRWNAPTDRSISGFRMMRDGAPIPESGGLPLSATTTQLADQAVTAGEQHDYVVVAVGPEGDSPPSNGVGVQIPLPPLRVAQLRGIYDVTLVVRGATNLASLSGIPSPEPGEHRTTTWGFQPLCEPDEGACPTGWTGRSGMLRPPGDAWSGRVFGPEARCRDGSREPSPIELHLEVGDAAMIAGAWSVVSFTGAYSVGFHCPGFLASHGSVDVTGHHR
jgi:hypothetical protein